MKLTRPDFCIRTLKQGLVNRWSMSKSFVLAKRKHENTYFLPEDISYVPQTIDRLWGPLQMKLRPANPSPLGSRKNFPLMKHSIPEFNDRWGFNSQKIVDDACLWHLLEASKPHDVLNAIDAFSTFATTLQQLPIEITNESGSMQTLFHVSGIAIETFFGRLPALQNFGNLKVLYDSDKQSIAYPFFDNLYPDQGALSHAPAGSVNPDCNFHLEINDNGVTLDKFGLVTLELKNAAHKVTSGLHLGGLDNCRPGTSDAEIYHLIQNGPLKEKVKVAEDRFKAAADQAFQQAFMNKCELAGICDVAGIHLLSFLGSEVENMGGCFKELKQGIKDGHRSQKMNVKYNSVYCAHWEEGEFYYALICAIANQMYKKLYGLKEYLDEYSAAVKAGGQLPGYRDVKLDKDVHRRVNDFYNQCALYYNTHRKR